MNTGCPIAILCWPLLHNFKRLLYAQVGPVTEGSSSLSNYGFITVASSYIEEGRRYYANMNSTFLPLAKHYLSVQ